MDAGEWFRSTEWSDEVELDFRKRLARARPDNRVQYRRIKAISLLRTGGPDKQVAARQLLMEVLDSSDAPDFERVMALSTLGKHALRAGHLDEAESNLRAALMLAGPAGSGTYGLEEAWIAQIALARGDRPALEQARAQLERRAADPPLLLSVQFEIAVTAARMAIALGDRSDAAARARTAIALAGAEHSGLAKHPRLGLVQTDDETMAWLRNVAGDS